MVRLIVFIVIFAIFLGFIVLNLDNRCDVSLGLKTFRDVPVFLSSLFSFIFGMLCAIPLVFTLRQRRKGKNAPSHDAVLHGPPGEIDEIKKEKGAYGID